MLEINLLLHLHLLDRREKNAQNFWVLATVLLSCILGGRIHQSMTLFFLSPSLLQKILYLVYFFISPTLSFQKRLVAGDYDYFVFSLQYLSQPVKSKLKPYWLSIIFWQDKILRWQEVTLLERFSKYFPFSVLSRFLSTYILSTMHGREGLDESCINSEEVLFLISLICNVSKIVAWRWVIIFS